MACSEQNLPWITQASNTTARKRHIYKNSKIRGFTEIAGMSLHVDSFTSSVVRENNKEEQNNQAFPVLSACWRPVLQRLMVHLSEGGFSNCPCSAPDPAAHCSSLWVSGSPQLQRGREGVSQFYYQLVTSWNLGLMDGSPSDSLINTNDFYSACLGKPWAHAYKIKALVINNFGNHFT